MQKFLFFPFTICHFYEEKWMFRLLEQKKNGWEIARFSRGAGELARYTPGPHPCRSIAISLG